MLRRTFASLIPAVAATGLVWSQNRSDWDKPFPPHKIAGNLYYVGTEGLSTYLITSSQGHILINSSFERTVPMISAAIEKLGFKYYPQIAADYEKAFKVWKAISCDIFLGAHGNYYGMVSKYERWKADPKLKVWVDPAGYKAYIAEREQAFHAEWERQKRSA